jgi:5-methylcytosine-specific restriction protein B
MEGLWASSGRYRDASKAFAVRAPEGFSPSDAPFAAIIDASNASSGPYGGMSLVLFPTADAPALIAMVVGTQGLAPDEEVLTRPGHGRKLAAIAHWLSAEFGGGELVAWAKNDPTRVDIELPSMVIDRLPAYRDAFRRYGNEIYALFAPSDDRQATNRALAAFIDLTFSERHIEPRAAFKIHVQETRAAYSQYLLPDVSRRAVQQLLEDRRFVVLEGPPGTGKTRTALQLLSDEYGGCGRTMQFHPSTTYESFVGGLAPVQTEGTVGLQFAPVRGALMSAAIEASQDDRPYLLHIDEINRADLSKVLGEAIFLFEPDDPDRSVEVAYDFGPPIGRRFRLPPNLHVLGTMNSADRSIAILDIAVRRRFAFTQLWPQVAVVRELGSPLMQQAFDRLVSIFVEYARGDAMALVPGHSYFLEKDDRRGAAMLQTGLVPLIREYISQGYAAGFAEELLAFLQWVEGLEH